MDILNWVYLIKNKLTRTTVQDPQKDLVILGNNVSYAKRGDKYQSYGMTVEDFATYINESVAGNCPIQMNFKPGSIGEKVSFSKVSGTDPNTFKDVIIPGQLEITRGVNGGGIYNIAIESNFNSNNSPENTMWATKYNNPTLEGWAPLWDFTGRTYDKWRAAIETPEGNYAPPQYVGMPVVMKYDNGVDSVRYWLIIFTEWGVGNYGEYGFAYDRYEIYPSVTFVKPDYDDTAIDIVSPGVHIARNSNGGQIYNAVNEPYAEVGVSPRNTRWNSIYTDYRAGYSGYTDLSNLESRVYTDFALALDYAVGNNVLDTDLIMHDMTTDLYYKVNFSDWTSGGNGGGFEYTRTVIPQSCGIKFADGTVMNTAVTAGGATGTEMVYTQGLLSPQVQSDFIQLPDTITDSDSTLFKTYKLGGIVDFGAPGVSSYAYLIGVIVGDDRLKLINDATVIGANGVTTYDGISGKFAVNALVKNASTGAALPLIFATIVLDNTIASPNDYFVSIVAVAGASWTGTAYIDIEFMSDQTLSYYN